VSIANQRINQVWRFHDWLIAESRFFHFSSREQILSWTPCCTPDLDTKDQYDFAIVNRRFLEESFSGLYEVSS
jgi:hypothetical protein